MIRLIADDSSFRSALPMPHRLTQQFDALRRRLTRLIWLHGVSGVLTVLLAGTLLVCVIDWWWHIDSPALRLTCGVALLAVAGYTVWRLLVRPAQQPISDVDLAIEIERHHPQWQGRLSTAAGLLNQRRALGVRPMRTIHTQSMPLRNDESSRLDDDLLRRTLDDPRLAGGFDIVDSHSPRLLAGVALFLCALVGVCVLADQSSASLALTRLLRPWSAPDWPRRNQLQLLDADLRPLSATAGLAEPLRVVEGGTLPLFIDDANDKLPARVMLELRRATGETETRRLRKTTLHDEQGDPHAVCPLELAGSGERLQFRAIGGDDDRMLWRSVEIVPPPVLSDLQVTITPPAYTGQPVESLPAGVGQVRTLAGSEVAIEGRSDKLLAAALLHVGDKTTQPMQTGPDRLTFSTSIVLDQPTRSTYGIELQDNFGITQPVLPRYDLQVIEDQTPLVTLTEPAVDLLVTPQAEVPLVAQVRDDLAIQHVALAYKTTISSGPGQQTPLPLDPPMPQETTIAWTWSLAELDLSPGSQVTFHIEATDAFDLDDPHIGRSARRTIRIVSEQDKLDELAGRQEALADVLAKLAESQDRLLAQTRGLHIQQQTAGELRPEDADQLRRLEQAQRQIEQQLARSNRSVSGAIEQMQAELTRNRIEDEPTQQRLDELSDLAAPLKSDVLPKINRSLTAARKRVGNSTDDGGASAEQPEDIEQLLSDTQRAQETAVDTLQEMTDLLSGWRQQRQIFDQLDRLIADQEVINDRTAGLAQETLSKSADELAPQQRATLERLADRQRTLADQLQRLGEQVAPQDGQPRTAASDQLNESLNSEQTTAAMRQAARDLAENSIGQATQSQQEIIDTLKKSREQSESTPQSDAEELVKQLADAGEQIESLHKRQEQLKQEWQANNSDSPTLDTPEPERADELRREQEQLTHDVAEMVRRLRKMRARDAAGTTNRAQDQMQRALDRMQSDRMQSDRMQSDRMPDDRLRNDESTDDVEELMEEAEADLQQAERELARQRQQLEEQLAFEEIRRLVLELPPLINRQSTIIEETERLNELSLEQGRLTRGQSRSVRTLAQTQQSLGDEVRDLAERQQAAAVVEWALTQSAEEMTRAAERLTERETDAATLSLEESARSRLKEVHTILAEQVKKSQENQQTEQQQQADEGEEQEKGTGPPGDVIPLVAQLTLLRSLQQSVNERTATLLQADAEVDRESLDRLQQEQARLAELAQTLLEEFTASQAEETPEELPNE